jgi:hypothetical protein
MFLEAEDALPFNGLDEICFSLDASEGAFHFNSTKDRYQEVQHAFRTHPCLSLEDQMHPQPKSASQFLLLDEEEEETMHASSTRHVCNASKREGSSKGMGSSKAVEGDSMKYESIMSDDITPGYPASASLFLHNEEDVSLYTGTYPAVHEDRNLSDGLVEDSNHNSLPPSKRSSDTSLVLQSSSEASVLQSYMTRQSSQCHLSSNPACPMHSGTTEKQPGDLYCLAILDESSGKPIRVATCAEAHLLKQHKVPCNLPQANRLLSSSRVISQAKPAEDAVKQSTVVEPGIRVSRRQAKQEPEQCLDASHSAGDQEQGAPEVEVQVLTAQAMKTFTCNPRRGGPCDYCGATGQCWFCKELRSVFKE